MARNLLKKSVLTYQSLRYMSKFSMRPVKVLYPNQTNLEDNKPKPKPKVNLNRLNIANTSQESELPKSPETFLKMNARDREESNIIILEGKRLVIDALNCNLKLQNLFYDNDEYGEDLILSVIPSNIKTMVTSKELKRWSQLSTCPGILGVFEKPDQCLLNEDANYPVSVICDNVRDPGNMGSLLRCASAAGCKNIWLTKGCVDVWDRKVLRAASGAHFRLNLESKLTWEDLPILLNEVDCVYMADIFENDNMDNQSNSRVYTDTKFKKSKTALIIGGETHGLSPDARKIVENKNGFGLVIPMKNNMNSLNSATALGILLFEIKRQFEKV